jgi:hypothetical protein
MTGFWPEQVNKIYQALTLLPNKLDAEEQDALPQSNWQFFFL